MKRGVVMAIHKQHTVVMTADGQFLQAPFQGSPQIGDEITFDEEIRRPLKKWPYRYVSAAAILLLLFIPILLFAARDTHPVVAYLSIDINPSIEIGMDEQAKVRELRALNEDGSVIIENLKYKGIAVDTVAAAILDRASVSHYLDTANKDIVITSMLINDGVKLKLNYEALVTGKVGHALRELLDKLAAEAISANVTTLSVPIELRDEAAANGISSGKMAVYLMAKDEGYELELEQLKQKSIDSVTESIGGVRKIVGNADDMSKEKLKALVAKEKQEKKEKHERSEKKPVAVKATAAPTDAKPTKPVISSKPNTGTQLGAAGIKPSARPEHSHKPKSSSRPDVSSKPKSSSKPIGSSKPKDSKQDDKDRKERNGRSDDDNNGNNDHRGDDNRDDKKNDKKNDDDHDNWNLERKDDSSRRDHKGKDRDSRVDRK